MSPLSLHKPSRDGAGLPQAAAAVKRWTRTTLDVGSEVVVSVNELACGVPGCPPLQTVVIVLRPDGPIRKLSIHKRLLDVFENDVVAGWAASDEQ